MMTVSRVINGNGYVKEDTRNKVLEAIEKLDYYPNNLGRSLNNNKVNIIAVLAPVPQGGGIENDPYYTGLLYGIEVKLAEYSYDILLSTQRRKNIKGKHEFNYFRPFNERKADALILMGAHLSTSDIDTIREKRIPFCVIGDRPDTDCVHTIDTNNKEGYKKILRKAFDMGHREIAFFGLDEINFNIQERFVGYCEFLDEKKLIYREDFIVRCPHRPDDNNQEIIDKLKSWNSSKTRPTLITCGNDNVAISTMAIARKMNIKIPAQYSITGFDGHPTGQNTNPRLTTMKQPLEEMGSEAARLILNHLDNPENPCGMKYFDVTLIEGESLIPV